MSPGVTSPSLAWAICTVARSGSTWLSQLAASTNRLGYPDEYLLHWPSWRRQLGLSESLNRDAYLACLVQQRVTPNGVFAIKGSCTELAPFFELYPNAACVWLVRENKIEQAVSWHRAHDLGLWTHGSPPAAACDLDRALERSLWFYDEIARRDAQWQKFFVAHRIDPLVLTYEAVCRDPLAAVRRMATFLGIDAQTIDRVDSPLRVQRSGESEELSGRLAAALAKRAPSLWPAAGP